jgi:hypothetical protein
MHQPRERIPVGADNGKPLRVNLFEGQRPFHCSSSKRGNRTFLARPPGKLVDALNARQRAIAIEANRTELRSLSRHSWI